MDPDPETLFANIAPKDGLVETVEPSDLKAVWKMVEEMRGQRDSNEHIAIDARMYANACSPGANVLAVWYRASFLGLIAKQTGLLAPEVPDDVADVVFKIAASFPMKPIQPGVVSKGLPLDVEAFVKQIQDELRQRGLKV